MGKGLFSHLSLGMDWGRMLLDESHTDVARQWLTEPDVFLLKFREVDRTFFHDRCTTQLRCRNSTFRHLLAHAKLEQPFCAARSTPEPQLKSRVEEQPGMEELIVENE